MITSLGFGIFVLVSGNKSQNTINTKIDNPDSTPEISSPTNSTTISLSDLKTNNGINGKACWVASDGIVYFVPEGTKDWVNGSHTKSKGKVKCGADSGSAISSSPHGDSVLEDLTKIGTLE
jgi:predicted heme/steroid binding protein